MIHILIEYSHTQYIIEQINNMSGITATSTECFHVLLNTKSKGSIQQKSEINVIIRI